MHKKYDLAVKTGSYTDAQGQTKGRYENIGAVMQGNDGFFIILKRTFNPAGVPNPDDRDSVMVSMFEPREQNQQSHAGSGQGRGASNNEQSRDQQFDDDIPF